MLLTCCLLSQASPTVIVNPFFTPVLEERLPARFNNAFSSPLPIFWNVGSSLDSQAPQTHTEAHLKESKTHKILPVVLLQKRWWRTSPSERKDLEGNSPTVMQQSRLEDSVAGLQE